MRTTLLVCTFCLANVSAFVISDDKPADGVGVLKYGDGMPDGVQSLGGNGEMIRFEAPAGTKISQIKIHGSRYGLPAAPKEDFLIYFLSADEQKVLSTQMAPYSLFDHGEEKKWVTVNFKEPVEVPTKFWVVLDFRANQRKGVYVSYDTSTEGKNSRRGLPGVKSTETKNKADWLIEAVVAK